jgi:hypothetical protein
MFLCGYVQKCPQYGEVPLYMCRDMMLGRGRGLYYRGTFGDVLNMERFHGTCTCTSMLGRGGLYYGGKGQLPGKSRSYLYMQVAQLTVEFANDSFGNVGECL